MAELSREDVQALLPWYAAGGLSAAESRQVADWLAGPGADDQPLHDELTWLRLTARQVQADTQEQLPAANQGLETLLQRVRLETADGVASVRQVAAAPRAARVSPSAPSPWQAFWQWLRHASPTRSLGLAGLALAQAAVIVVLLQGPGRDTDPGQVPLSDPRLPDLTEAALLQVSFAPTATEAQIRAALLQARATLVAGPGSLGIYTVAVPREAAETAAAALRLQAGVVESVLALPAR